MIILYTGFGISMSVFMMTGYIKSIPKDIEESAVIDGANIMQAYNDYNFEWYVDME